MITCSVCGTRNDDLATLCISCKSYLQSKIDTLDLFSTIWGLIDSPKAIFKKIVLAQHKNYVLLLSSLFGISLAYTVFWYKNLGPLFSNALTLLGTGLLLGPPVGMAFVLCFSVVLNWVSGMFGGNATLRNTFAVVSYSSLPIIFTLVFVFPVELAMFGLDFFGNNPSPIVIKPIAYIILVGFDFLGFVWSWILLIEGSIVMNGISRMKAALVTLFMMIILGMCSFVIHFV